MIASQDGMKQEKDKIMRKIEKEKANVVLWVDEGLVHSINRLFFFQDTMHVHIGMHVHAHAPKHHIPNPTDVLSGTKSLLSVLGTFSGLPGFQRDMQERFECELEKKKKKEKQKEIDSIVEQCQEI